MIELDGVDDILTSISFPSAKESYNAEFKWIVHKTPFLFTVLEEKELLVVETRKQYTCCTIYFILYYYFIRKKH